MRITFLVGGLEPGQDGVGDYTRLLALECAGLGATCQVIAVADRHARGRSSGRFSSVETIRLPDHLSWPSRLEAVERATQWSAAQWVSVQFVPFSYQRWGVAMTFVRALPRLIEPARLHVMLHEIWIGSDGSWRRRLMSEAQRRSVLRLCRHPGTLAHTSNRAYQHILGTYGVGARVLPLFGNIPVAGTDAMAWLAPRLATAGCDAGARRERWWLFVLFGTLHPSWPPEPLFERLQQAAAEARKRIAVLSVGRLGGGEALWRDLTARYAGVFPLLRLGEQPELRVSEVLNAVDFGIATSPLGLLGKSGTAMAMFEHGLPVIVNREDGPAAPDPGADLPEDTLTIRLDSDFSRRLCGASRTDPGTRRAAVAAAFLADLEAASARDASSASVSVVA
jgi:hypothetical protein